MQIKPRDQIEIGSLARRLIAASTGTRELARTCGIVPTDTTIEGVLLRAIRLTITRHLIWTIRAKPTRTRLGALARGMLVIKTTEHGTIINLQGRVPYSVTRSPYMPRYKSKTCHPDTQNPYHTRIGTRKKHWHSQYWYHKRKHAYHHTGYWHKGVFGCLTRYWRKVIISALMRE